MIWIIKYRLREVLPNCKIPQESGFYMIKAFCYFMARRRFIKYIKDKTKKDRLHGSDYEIKIDQILHT
jgi:hypothetical protein